MAKRGRFTAENGSVVKAMFHVLAPEDMWPEDMPTPLRRRILNHEYAGTRAGRHQLTKIAQVQQLRVLGHTGPVLDDSETLVVETGAQHTQLLVDQASNRLFDGLAGSAAGARIHNALFHDPTAGGRHTTAAVHCHKHRAAAFETHRVELGLTAVSGPKFAFLEGSNSVVANLQGVWESAGGVKVVVRAHATPTAADYDRRPTSAEDVRIRFHETHHALQHDMLVAGTAEAFLIVIEGPVPKDRRRRTTQVTKLVG